MEKVWLMLGAGNAALCVVLGAFGAHGLKGKIEDASLAAFQTGVQYHFYHSLGLLIIAFVSLYLASAKTESELQLQLFNYAASFMFVGILLFSGSLYGLSLTQLKILGPITPLGGFAFIAAWLCFVFAIWKNF